MIKDAEDAAHLLISESSNVKIPAYRRQANAK
jgi:hypothetical protein